MRMNAALVSFLLAVSAACMSSVSAFNPSFQPKTLTTSTSTTTTTTTTTTQLAMASYSRRDAIKQTLIGVSTTGVIVGGPGFDGAHINNNDNDNDNDNVANAFSQQLDDYALTNHNSKQLTGNGI
mmetsp:Transcript_9957/g.24084  ORF Transcript_9957/g.24084 Transcript_9957/m.24084 type:complete len:125 (-) Transcript_9957:378-752(-)|eukprot:CAMPEP_0113480240 /NCGR_PEP_ID=MMETSP0014_2-20120614/21769_1 /TAXON_ID=2857 /ORGANISM="Nitzschia sp." /LENGTH=124 /DNA_ID=CAMNT_0000373655 /DNA_START=114 /DNA_END=488 /DNA_ORIENTATION=+ /assembly_acc=CAM_ASM_000159